MAIFNKEEWFVLNEPFHPTDEIINWLKRHKIVWIYELQQFWFKNEKDVKHFMLVWGTK